MEIRFIHPIVENDHFIFVFYHYYCCYYCYSFKFLVNMYINILGLISSNRRL